MHPHTGPEHTELGPEALAKLIEDKVRASGTSFYWGMRILEKTRRQAMYAVYAFCREVDDIADEDDIPPLERLRRLDVWRDEVGRIYTGEANHPIARALIQPARDYALNQADLIAVIDGVAMDAECAVTRPDLATLDLYCDRVACAVGRLSVRIFGPFTPRCDDVAAALGRALQLTNILRDVEEDAGMGRLYLPDELLSAYGIKGEDPVAILAHPALPLVRRDLAVMARRYFAEADAAMAECPKATMKPSLLMRATYRAILDKLEAGDWQLGRGRVRLPAGLKLWYAVRHALL
jgi:presqualene diphosphate synthase